MMPFGLMQEISAKLRADANLNAWLVAKFSKALGVYVGVDDQSQPIATNCPMVTMRPGSYSPSSDRSHRLVTVVCACVLSKDATTTTGTEVAMDGLDLLEQFYSRVETALSDWFANEYGGQVQFGDTITETAYPLFRVSWSLTFQEGM